MSIFLSLDALLGIIFLVVGLLLKYKPPKKINMLYGYRTTRSMQSQEAWDFAQKSAAQRSIEIGLFLLIIGILGHFWLRQQQVLATALSLFALLAAILYLIIHVENALKKKFKKQKP
ncbi:SdpI family protein [Mesonia sediminis]|uniref:SdpI family protein n=1 Tax=Mesonia sediminis TaxID=1703946 RepID=A0ABW5SF05_9FLAO